MASAARSASERGRAVLGELLRPPRELADAEAILTARCMERNGFRYPPAEVRGRGRPESSTVAGALAGTRPLSLEEAQAHGYRYQVNHQLPREEDAAALVAEYLATLSEDEQRAYNEALSSSTAPTEEIELFDGMQVGTPTAGCIPLARAALFGSSRAFLRWCYVPQGIWRCGLTEPQDEPTVREAARQYVAGMRSAGYTVDGPGHAVRAAADRFGLGWDEPTEQERAMAIADAEWQARTCLHELLDELRLRDAADWVSTHVDELEQLYDLQRTALQRALKIIESSRSA